MHVSPELGYFAVLFAGLEVDTEDRRGDAGLLVQHLAVRVALLVAVAFAIARSLSLEPRLAMSLALALLTPSTGFILDSLQQLGLTAPERRWVMSKAVATELLTLLVLFGTMRSTTVERMGMSILVLAGRMVLLPIVLRAFAAPVVPFVPRSEFALLLMIAVVCAFVTREFGVYYLVGAFVVGMGAS